MAYFPLGVEAGERGLEDGNSGIPYQIARRIILHKS